MLLSDGDIMIIIQAKTPWTQSKHELVSERGREKEKSCDENNVLKQQSTVDADFHSIWKEIFIFVD